KRDTKAQVTQNFSQMEYSIYKKTIQSPPKVLSGYGSSSQSHSSLCSFNSEPYPSQIFRSDFNYCYETPSKSGTSQYSLTFIGNSSATSKQTNTQPGAL
ncbi:hypothetical protein, partial [Duncaniella muris]|uniref:hypothetical protein n=1 Tax=Duncaniella muris TaxID=2094150 RepID=UPI0027298AD6